MSFPRRFPSLILTAAWVSAFIVPGIQPALSQNASRNILAGAIAGSSGQIAVSRGDGLIAFYSPVSGQLIRSVATDDFVEQMAFSPDGHRLAAVGTLHIRIYDTDRGAQTEELEPLRTVPTSLAFTPDRKQLVIGDSVGSITQVDLNTGKTVRSWGAHQNEIDAMAVSPDGRYIAAGSWDTTISLWDTETGLRKGLLKGHTQWVAALAFDQTSKKLVSGGWDSLVNVWDIATGKCIASGALTIVAGIPMTVNAILFSRDGKYLFGTTTGAVVMFDAATGVKIRAFDHQSAQTWLVATRDDNRHIEVLGRDGSLAILDIAGTDPEQHLMLQ